MESMQYISVPNIPKEPAKRAVVDGRISKEIEEGLLKLGMDVIKTHPYPGLYEAISYHPDIMMHHVGRDMIVYAPGIVPAFLDQLKAYRFQLVKGSTPLGYQYPYNIAYNVARVGRAAFHNLKYTDPVLKEALVQSKVELIHVNQGYSKCAVSIVDESSFITFDPGIAKAGEEKGFQVLLVKPEEGIRLPGLKSGFIGGSSGLVDKDKWAITGDIYRLECAYQIIGFLNARGIEVVCLSQGEVVDTGSILPI